MSYASINKHISFTVICQIKQANKVNTVIYRICLCYSILILEIYYLNFKVFFLLSTRLTNDVRYIIFSVYDFKIKIKDFRHFHNVISLNIQTFSAVLKNVYQYILGINTSVILDPYKLGTVLDRNKSLISIQLHREISKSYSTSFRIYQFCLSVVKFHTNCSGLKPKFCKVHQMITASYCFIRSLHNTKFRRFARNSKSYNIQFVVDNRTRYFNHINPTFLN